MTKAAIALVVTLCAACAPKRAVVSTPEPNAPLVFLNGERYTGSISDLKPEQIASVEVLKGNAALALYGPGARNGVIVIRMK